VRLWDRVIIGKHQQTGVGSFAISAETLRLRSRHQHRRDEISAWLFCIAVVAALFRLLFIALRMDHHLWPAPLVYLGLAVLAASVVYVTCFNRI
jgi:hypothetical protein